MDDNQSIVEIGVAVITAAVTQSVITAGVSAAQVAQAFKDGLYELAEMDVQVRFVYGSGGTNIKVYIQTSLDQGATWIDIWCFTATTASKTRARMIKPDGNEVTPTDGALADDTVAAGKVLGDRLRAKITTTGVYAGNTSVQVTAALRGLNIQ